MVTGTRVVARRGVMAGWPCFDGTRIAYDTVLRLVDFETVMPEDVPAFFPSLSADAWVAAARYAVRAHLSALDEEADTPESIPVMGVHPA